jgi:hypothetical protein
MAFITSSWIWKYDGWNVSHNINFSFYTFRLCVTGSTCEILCNRKYSLIFKLPVKWVSCTLHFFIMPQYEMNLNPVGVTASKRFVHTNFIYVQCRKDSCILSYLSFLPHFCIFLCPSFYLFVLHFVISIVVSLFLLMFHSLFASYAHFLSFCLSWHVCLFLFLFRTQVIQTFADHLFYLPNFNVLNHSEMSLQYAFILQ